MVSIEFGRLDAANEMRDKVAQYLSRTDKRNEKTVRLESSTPDRVIERVKEAAFGSREQRAKGAGKAELTDKERESLKRQHSNFSWQQHGFQAMAVKAALQSEGVTEWMDYYEPGEGVDSALAKLRSSKGNAVNSRASIGAESMRTDTDEMRNTGRRSKQAERVSSDRVDSAKRPAIVEQDEAATDFLQEEMEFGGDPFDVSVQGRREASGRDVELVEERHEQRSMRAQRQDEMEAAPTTSNPLKWSANPDQYDFPGVDTIDPDVVQDTRSERAREMDANQRAPIAESAAQWANNPDEYDLPGVDTPGSVDGIDPMNDTDAMDAVDENTPMQDTRAQQGVLDFAASATEARESRLDTESSDGGLLEDTRSNPTRGVETNDTDAGEQAGLTDMDAAKAGKEAMDEVDEDVSSMDEFL